MTKHFTPPNLQKYVCYKGSAVLVMVIVLAIVSSMIGLSVAKIGHASMNATASNTIAMQASNIASSDAALLHAVNYEDLTASNRSAVSGTAFQHETLLSNESSYTDTIKQKIATINVYKGDESIPRSTLQVTRYSVEKQGSSIPAGSIIPWYGNLANIPDGFALCDGKNGTPDLRDRFLVGAGNAYKLGDIGGENSVKLAPTQIGNHYHAFGSYYNNDGWFIRLPSYATFPMPPGSGRVWWNGHNGGGGFDGPLATQSLDMVTSLAISTAAQEAHENRPPYYALHYIMKL